MSKKSEDLSDGLSVIHIEKVHFEDLPVKVGRTDRIMMGSSDSYDHLPHLPSSLCEDSSTTTTSTTTTKINDLYYNIKHFS